MAASDVAEQEPYRPLSGVRVLDLSRLIVGGLTTRQLADLGADVVKVEEPGSGDYLRAIPPFVDGEGVWHHLLNRNKRSIALDIVGSETDRETLRRLVGVADVVVDVSRPGSLERMGIDIAQFRRERPELIVCSITGFGQTGPWSMMAAHGMNMDSLASTIIIGYDGDEARFEQVAYTGLSQEQGSLNGALAICAALVNVRGGGSGAWIDISCWDGLVDMNRTAIAYLAATGETVQESQKHMWGSLHRIYKTKDGKSIFIAVIEEKFWKQFCEAVDRPDLLDRWKGKGGVDYGDPSLIGEMEEIIGSRTAEEWQDTFIHWGLPGSQLMTLEEVMQSEHFRERALLEQVDGRRIPNMAGPIRWIDHPGHRPGWHPQPAPEVGAHGAAVLADWLGER